MGRLTPIINIRSNLGLTGVNITIMLNVNTDMYADTPFFNVLMEAADYQCIT